MTDPALQPDWPRLVADLPAAPSVQRLEVGGRIFWAKRPEQRSLRWRLQKGDPRRSFARERAAWQMLDGHDLPLAPLVWSGPDCLITADAGRPVSALLADGDGDQAGPALIGAAQALGRLHAAGFAHGRPNLKDVLWDGCRAVFIDLEKFPLRADLAHAQRRDLLLFAFSAHAVAGRRSRQIDRALAAYVHDEDSRAVMVAVWRRLRRLRGLASLAAHIGHWTGSREWQAVPLVIDWARDRTS